MQDTNQLGAYREAIDRWIERGISGYPAFQRRLADSISPAEAAAACRQTRRALYALGIALLLLLLFALNIPRLKTGFSTGEALAWLAVPTLAFSLFLIGRFQIPYAARVLFVFLAIAEVAFDPSNWSRVSDFVDSTMGDNAGQMMYFMLGGYVLGAAIDIGASLVPHRRHKLARRLLLVGVSGVMLMAFAEEPYAAYIVLALGTLLWIWPLGPWMARRFAEENEDVAILTGAAFKRWRRNALGRLLAVVTVATSGITFLNSFDYRETLLKTPQSAAFFGDEKAADSTHETAYFWLRQRSFLGPSDFSSAALGLYTLPEATLKDPKIRQEVEAEAQGDKAAVGSRRLEEADYKNILPKLQRLDSPAAFHAAWKAGQPVWAIDGSGNRALYLMERLDHNGHIKEMSRSEIEATLGLMPVLQAGVASCALLAYVLFWRRGGDTPIAAWAGVWLSGIAAYFTFNSFHFSFHPIILSIGGSPSPGECLMLGTIAVLMSLSGVLLALSLSGVAPWAVLFHLRRLREDQAAQEEIRTWWRRIPMAWKFWGAALLTLLLSLTLFLFEPDVSSLAMWLLYAYLMGALLVGLIALIRWLSRRRLPLSRIPPSLPLAFLAAVAMTWTAIWASETNPLPHYALAAVGLNAALLLALGTWIILRDNFLHIAGGKDLSYLLIALMLPISFEMMDGIVDEMVWKTGLFSIGAGEIASMILVVTLLQPLQRVLENLLSSISNPGLYRLRRWIEGVVERCALTQDLSSTTGLLNEFFEKFKLRRYAFLKRVSASEFRAQVNCLGEFDKPVELSASLRRHLSKTAGFVDLDLVAYEWEHFFEQFELYRLQRDLGVRYLLPIKLGDSLQGLLLLPDEIPARNFSKEGLVNFVNHLGIMTTQRAH